MKTSFDIVEYGARGDGQSLNTTAIQAAIDACHEAGGGTVVCGSGIVSPIDGGIAAATAAAQSAYAAHGGADE